MHSLFVNFASFFVAVNTHNGFCLKFSCTFAKNQDAIQRRVKFHVRELENIETLRPMKWMWWNKKWTGWSEDLVDGGSRRWDSSHHHNRSNSIDQSEICIYWTTEIWLCDWSLIIRDYTVMRIRKLTIGDASVNFILFDAHFIGYDFTWVQTTHSLTTLSTKNTNPVL